MLVCVKIDLEKPVVDRLCVNDKWLQIEYEGLHIICAKCGCYGYHSTDCVAPKEVSNVSYCSQVVSVPDL